MSASMKPAKAVNPRIMDEMARCVLTSSGTPAQMSTKTLAYVMTLRRIAALRRNFFKKNLRD